MAVFSEALLKRYGKHAAAYNNVCYLHSLRLMLVEIISCMQFIRDYGSDFIIPKRFERLLHSIFRHYTGVEVPCGSIDFRSADYSYRMTFQIFKQYLPIRKMRT